MCASIDNLINVNFTKGRNDLLRFGLMLGGKGQHRPYVFTPADLFLQGEQGAFYIPRPVVNGTQALFQDAAGTVSVTADGDPVGKMLDQSGNGNHASQAASGKRPIYRTDGTLHWLQFDGVDDFLFVQNKLPLSDAFFAGVGYRDPVDATNNNNGLFSQYDARLGRYILQLYTGGKIDIFLGGSQSTPRVDVSEYASAVVTKEGSLHELTVGVQQSTLDLVRDIDDAPLAIGASTRSGGFLEGNIYSAVFCYRAIAAGEKESLTNYLDSTRPS